MQRFFDRGTYFTNISNIHFFIMTMRKILIALTLFTIFCPIAKATVYTLEITPADFTSCYDYSYSNNVNHKTQAHSESGATFEVEWISDRIWYKNTEYSLCAMNGYIYNTTNLESIKEVKVYTYDGSGDYIYIYYGDSQKPASNQTIGDNDGYFQVKNYGTESQIKKVIITFKIDDTPPTIELHENSSENSTIISSNLGNTVNVNLSRSLTANMWNAICLPFSLNSNQKTALFGKGYSLQEFSSIGNENGGTQLNFQAVATSDDLQAGIPYIVYPTISTTSQEISGVTIASTAEPAVVTKADNSGKIYTYQGIYIPTRLDNIAGDPKQVLFIGANNKFYWPKTSNPMKAFRAYFILPSAGASSNFSLSTEEQGVSDGISLSEVTGLDIQGSPNNIYTLHGQLVGSFSDQLPKGIYIANGRKFIVK